jgi:hypothetical protein
MVRMGFPFGRGAGFLFGRSTGLLFWRGDIVVNVVLVTRESIGIGKTSLLSRAICHCRDTLVSSGTLGRVAGFLGSGRLGRRLRTRMNATLKLEQGEQSYHGWRQRLLKCRKLLNQIVQMVY